MEPVEDPLGLSAGGVFKVSGNVDLVLSCDCLLARGFGLSSASVGGLTTSYSFDSSFLSFGAFTSS